MNCKCDEKTFSMDQYTCTGQISIFDIIRPSIKITKPIRLIELFAGIGSQAMALKRLGADFQHYRVVEFDKYAVKSYNAIHGTHFEPTDITQINGFDLGIVDTDSFTYVLTYSFPCQDLSVAGKQKGMAKGEGTRSGLLWEVERLLHEVDNLPQILLMENVPQVHGKKNMEDFQMWIDFLESKGYSNYWQDLNAKNYGVAQNRNRCFMVSILGDYSFKFPEPIELKKVMKDYLEDEVDEKYYINNEKAQKLIQKMIDNGTLANTIESANRVYDVCGVAPTMNTCGGGGLQPKILEANSIRMVRTEEGKALRKQYENHEIHHGFNEHREPELRKDGVTNTLSTVQKDNYICVAMRGRNPTNPSYRTPGIELEQTLEVNGNGTSNCLTSVQKDNLVLEKPVLLGGVGEENEFGTQYRQGNRVYSSNAVAMCLNSQPVGNTGGNSYLYNVNYRIRKLTPRECWRFMDFSDEDFEKAAEVNSNTQLYKQAGNSIVVNVLVAILGQLLPGKENVYKELSECE